LLPLIALVAILASCASPEGDQAADFEVSIPEGDRTLDNGASQTFTASLSITAPSDASYAWYVDDKPRSGESSPSFVFSASPKVATVYRIRVSANAGGLEKSATVNCTVREPAVIPCYIKYTGDLSTWTTEPGSPTTFTAAGGVRFDNKVFGEGVILREKSSGKYYYYDEKNSREWTFTGITAPAGTKLEMQVDGGGFVCIAEGNAVWHYDDANGWQKRTKSDGSPLLPDNVTILEFHEFTSGSFFYIDSSGSFASFKADGSPEGSMQISNLPPGTIEVLGMPPSELLCLTSSGAVVYVDPEGNATTKMTDPGMFAIANSVNVIYTFSTTP
jgi:hypothetical protein